MTNKQHRTPLQHETLFDELIRDLLEVSEAEYIDEFGAEETKQDACKVKELFNGARLAAGKKKLQQARRGLEERRSTSSHVSDIGIAEKRRKLSHLLERSPPEGDRLSIAARNSNTEIGKLSDADIESMFEDFDRLGAWSNGSEE